MWPVLFVLLVSVANGELRIRDYNGEVRVTRVRLDSIDGCLTYHLDADGDGRKDTLLLYFEQVSYQLVWNTEGEKVTIAGLGQDGDEHVMEFAAAYVVGTSKPVMVVKTSQGVEEGYRILVVDLIRTARGPRADVLLDGDAGWLNSQLTIVKPNIIESVHFRGWPVDRYVWDGDKFMKVKLD